MTKEMIISSNGHETMVAILEEDLAAEIFVERERQRGVVGNVYKGRVSKVLPGMQCAFIDLGLERDGFLYVADVVDAMEEFDKLDSGDDDENGKPKEKGPRPQPKIEELLNAGQEILVEVVKEPHGTKGARHTSHMTMAGRFLVFMPTVDHVGISRKIDSREERSRLRGIVREFREQRGFTGGVIIRTAASGRSKEDIVADLEAFHKTWLEIRQKMESRRAPAVVYQEQSLVGKLLRDLLTDEFQAIRIDNEVEHRRVIELVERILPNLAPRVKLYTKPYPIFEEYGVVISTRKRVKQSLERVLTEPCPYCSGTGAIKSTSTICYEIFNEVRKIGADLNGNRVLLRVNPEIARAFREEESAVLRDLRQSIGRDVTVKSDVQLHHEQFDVMAV